MVNSDLACAVGLIKFRQMGDSMATLAGGTTIQTLGLTDAENTFVSNVLQTNFPGATTPTNQAVIVDVARTNSTNTLFGTFRADAVQSAAINPTNSGISIVDLSGGTPNNNTVTNLVADDTTQAIFVTGTSSTTNTISVVFGGASTNTVVTDAGSQFVALTGPTNATVVSGTGNDSILGGGGNDRLQSGGDSVINGGSGNDTIIGGTGVATLGGGAGADSIVAAEGGSYLIGEAGNDTLVGRAGNDVFIYTSGGGSDTIVNFDPTRDTLAFTTSSDLPGSSLLTLINNATVSGGNTILTLADGSTITVTGVTGVNVNWFTVK